MAVLTEKEIESVFILVLRGSYVGLSEVHLAEQ
jgi:hypothetical protein